MNAPTCMAQSMADIHTDRPLHEIADAHASSRVLSAATRQTFSDIGANNPVSADDREAAFFEAAASMSTRKGQSYARRVALGDLQRLRLAVMAGQPIARDRFYSTGLPVTVRVQPDGTVTLYVDVTEATAAVADADQPHAVEDSAIVAAAIDDRMFDLEIA